MNNLSKNNLLMLWSPCWKSWRKRSIRGKTSLSQDLVSSVWRARANEVGGTLSQGKTCIWMPGEWSYFSIQGCWGIGSMGEVDLVSSTNMAFSLWIWCCDMKIISQRLGNWSYPNGITTFGSNSVHRNWWSRKKSEFRHFMGHNLLKSHMPKS